MKTQDEKDNRVIHLQLHEGPKIRYLIVAHPSLIDYLQIIDLLQTLQI